MQRIAAGLGALGIAACAGGDDSQLSELAQQGQRVYQNVCIACHAPDPSADGSLGPAVAGASWELLEARVLRGEYPPGYTPKRPGLAMPAFPYLEPELPALHAYLAEIDRGRGSTSKLPERSVPNEAPGS